MNSYSACGRVIDSQAKFTALVSPELVAEIIATVNAPALERRLTRIDGRPPLARLLPVLARSEVVMPTSTPTVCRDPDDDKLFACALEGRADYIVSEDRDVLAVARYEGIRTMSASDFIILLESQTR
jgi:putative PIN family toxin of toxin-antitoxin system